MGRKEEARKTLKELLLFRPDDNSVQNLLSLYLINLKETCDIYLQYKT